MTYFYLIIMGLTGLYLTLQLVSWLFFRRRLFPQTGMLFENTRYKLEWQTIFPANMMRLIVVMFAAAVFGFLLDSLAIVGWLSMPLGAAGGLAVNFLLNVWITPLYYRIHHENEPKEPALSGMTATVVEEISAESYGRIQVNNGRAYFYAAASANGRTLSSGDKVVIIECMDGLCFVESEEHFCDILFEETAQTDSADSEEVVQTEHPADNAEITAPEDIADVVDFHTDDV